MEPVKKQTKAQYCRHCSSSLVQPVEWSRVEEGWQVVLRCPDCQSVYELGLDQEEVSLFSLDLESGFQSLLEGLETLDRELFEGECEIFIAALRADQVYPMDF
jgi:hypothetical protein